jgi:hypothetical protein
MLQDNTSEKEPAKEESKNDKIFGMKPIKSDLD